MRLLRRQSTRGLVDDLLGDTVGLLGRPTRLPARLASARGQRPGAPAAASNGSAGPSAAAANGAFSPNGAGARGAALNGALSDVAEAHDDSGQRQAD